MMTLEQYLKKIPDFKGANWLLRVPLGIIFILQGLQKLPLDVSDAEAFGLPMSVWFFVAWGELFAGIGLLGINLAAGTLSLPTPPPPTVPLLPVSPLPLIISRNAIF